MCLLRKLQELWAWAERLAGRGVRSPRVWGLLTWESLEGQGSDGTGAVSVPTESPGTSQTQCPGCIPESPILTGLVWRDIWDFFELDDSNIWASVRCLSGQLTGSTESPGTYVQNGDARAPLHTCGIKISRPRTDTCVVFIGCQGNLNRLPG